MPCFALCSVALQACLSTSLVPTALTVSSWWCRAECQTTDWNGCDTSQPVYSRFTSRVLLAARLGRSPQLTLPFCFCCAEYDAPDCGQGLMPESNSITVRGPAGATRSLGYCVVARASLSSLGMSGFSSGPASRANGARRVSINVDPFDMADPRIRVYYSNDDTDSGLRMVLSASLPASILSEKTFKWGLTGVSGAATDIKGEPRHRPHCCKPLDSLRHMLSNGLSTP